MIGIVLTKLSGLSARVGGDPIQRRKTEQVVFEMRTEMAEAFAEMANKVRQKRREHALRRRQDGADNRLIAPATADLASPGLPRIDISPTAFPWFHFAR